jgi:hypothetical protein
MEVVNDALDDIVAKELFITFPPIGREQIEVVVSDTGVSVILQWVGCDGPRAYQGLRLSLEEIRQLVMERGNPLC